MPKLNLRPTAVISFVLAGFEEFGNPARVVFDALATYLMGDVVFFQVVFDFTSSAGVKKSILKLIKELEGPEYRGYVLNRFHTERD